MARWFLNIFAAFLFYVLLNQKMCRSLQEEKVIFSVNDLPSNFFLSYFKFFFSTFFQNFHGIFSVSQYNFLFVGMLKINIFLSGRWVINETWSERVSKREEKKSSRKHIACEFRGWKVFRNFEFSRALHSTTCFFAHERRWDFCHNFSLARWNAIFTGERSTSKP